MWATSGVEPEEDLRDFADSVLYSCPFERHTGGYNEVYMGAATMIRKLVKEGLSKKVVKEPAESKHYAKAIKRIQSIKLPGEKP